MNFFLAILVQLSFQQKDTLSPTYYHYSQSCNLSYVTEYFSELSLSKQNTFILKKTLRDSRSLQPWLSPAEKKQFPTKSIFAFGLWEKDGDTLRLLQTVTTREITVFPNMKIEFIISSDRLKKISSEGFNDFPETMTTQNVKMEIN